MLAEVSAHPAYRRVEEAEARYRARSARPRSSACAPSSRTATSASASSTVAGTSASRPGSGSPPRRRCTARWARRTGWRRRRRERRFWGDNPARTTPRRDLTDSQPRVIGRRASFYPGPVLLDLLTDATIVALFGAGSADAAVDGGPC